MIKLKPFLFAGTLALMVSPLFAQTDSTKTDDFLEMSLEDLMNVPIVSASKEKESSFDAPLTSCVITRQEMNNMGATSIPDALKYCPAIIVRELANGSYDVSIRGGIDGLPSYQFQNTNTTILAMIDNRPVFSNFQGGTYWQNLPVEIADVERIEVVYGPNAPMYGPNAVSGVINIITRKEYGNKPTIVHANVQSGIDNMYSAYIGHKISDKIEINASGNVSKRMRDKEEYYLAGQDRFTDSVSLTSLEYSARFPIRAESMKKNGLNFNINYTPTKDIFVNFNSSYNNNQTLSQLEVSTPLNVSTNNSNSHMLRGELYNFTIQSSYLSGTQGLLGNQRSYQHDYTTFDNYIDYNWKLKSKLSIRPAIAFQRASIDDRKYTIDENENGLFNNSGVITNLSGSIKVDYKPIDMVRIIAAVRADKFSKPDKVYPSYQLAANIKPSENHIFRVAAGRSYNSSFLVPTFANLLLFDTTTSTSIPTGTINSNTQLRLLGNVDRKLLQNDMFEIGYKSQLGKNVQVDVSIFNQTFQNFSVFVIQPANVNTVVIPTPPTATVNIGIKITNTPQNIDMKVVQNGVSMSVLIVSTNKMISFKPHFTVQQTNIKDYQKYYFAIGANDAKQGGTGLDLSIKSNETSKATPNWFGGFTLNINPLKRLNLGLSGYYFDKSVQTTVGGQSSTTGVITSKSVDNINGKAMFNAHLTYKIHDNISLGLNARNMLNNNAREGWGSDKIGSQFLGTLIVEY